jgi:hypothetical protein
VLGFDSLGSAFVGWSNPIIELIEFIWASCCQVLVLEQTWISILGFCNVALRWVVQGDGGFKVLFC